MAIRGIDGGPSFEGGPIGRSEHTVQQGETLEGIAKQYGFSSEELLKLNPQVSDPNKIQAGQTLQLPEVQDPHRPSAFSADQFERATRDVFGEAASTINTGEAKESAWFQSNPRIMPGQFQTDPSGKLVVSNQELIGLLQNLVKQNPGESATINFARLSGGETRSAGEAQFDYASPIPSSAKLDAGESKLDTPTERQGTIAPQEAQFDYASPIGSSGKLDAGEKAYEEVSRKVGDAGENVAFESVTRPGGATGGITVQLTPDLFGLTSEGNLLINNDQLANMLKSVGEQTQPGDMVAFQGNITKK